MGGPAGAYALGVYTDLETALAVQAGVALMPLDFQRNIQAAQGSYRPTTNYSADTHAGGGAIDISRWRKDGRLWTWAELCQIAEYFRQVGFAAWPREVIPKLWERHVHMERVGCSDASPGARSQWADYKADRNGLAGEGPDFLTRAYVNVTWDTYKAASPQDAKTQTPQDAVVAQEEDMDAGQDQKLNVVYALTPDAHDRIIQLQADLGRLFAFVVDVMTNVRTTSNSAFAGSWKAVALIEVLQEYLEAADKSDFNLDQAIAAKLDELKASNAEQWAAIQQVITPPTPPADPAPAPALPPAPDADAANPLLA